MKNPSLYEQREKQVKYLESVFGVILETLLGEPFVVQIVPGSEFIDPDKVIMGFEINDRMQDKKLKTKRQLELAAKREANNERLLTFVFTESAKYFNVDDRSLIVLRRGLGANDKHHYFLKFVCLYIRKRMRAITVEDVSKFRGNKNHTGALYHFTKAEKLYKENIQFIDDFNDYQKYMDEVYKKEMLKNVKRKKSV